MGGRGGARGGGGGGGGGKKPEAAGMTAAEAKKGYKEYIDNFRPPTKGATAVNFKDWKAFQKERAAGTVRPMVRTPWGGGMKRGRRPGGLGPTGG